MQNSKRVVGIVQARMGSTRLPAKAMMTLGNMPIIELVLRRLQNSKNLDELILATTENKEDDVLCAVAKRLGVKYFRGPGDDVLKRFVLAAEKYGADIVVRVCADNPLVTPEEVDRIVKHHIHTHADYSFNHIPAFDNQYPDGLGAEVINWDILCRVNECNSISTTHREHVTSYIWDFRDEFHIETVVAPDAIAGSGIKLDVDTESDFRKLAALISEGPDDIVGWDGSAIVKAYRKTNSMA